MKVELQNITADPAVSKTVEIRMPVKLTIVDGIVTEAVIGANYINHHVDVDGTVRHITPA